MELDYSGTGSILMQDGAKASAITIGDENGKAWLLAKSVQLAATSGLTVQGGSEVSATDGDMKLDGGASLQVLGGSKVTATKAVTLLGKQVEVSGEGTTVTAKGGKVVLGDETSESVLVGAGALVSSVTSSVHLGNSVTEWGQLTANTGSVTVEDGANVSAGTTVGITADAVDVDGTLTAQNGNVNIYADDTLTAAGSMTAKGGDVVLTGMNTLEIKEGALLEATKSSDKGGNVLLHGGAISVAGEVKAENGEVQLDGDKENKIAEGGSVIAGGSIKLQGGNLISDADNEIAGTATATAGDISLSTTTGSNTISGEATAKAGNISLSAVGGSNTISGTAEAKATATAGGKVALNGLGNTLKEATVIANGTDTGDGKAGVALNGTLANAIENSTVTATNLNVDMDGALNSVTGTAITGATGVTMGEAGSTLVNSVVGSAVSTGNDGADIALGAMLNNVSGGSQLNSAGSITLTGAPLGAQNLLETVLPWLSEEYPEIEALLLQYGLATKDDDGKLTVNLDLNGNIISGADTQLTAKQQVQLEGMLNAMLGGTVSAGTGAGISGEYNVLMNSLVSSATGNITLTSTTSGANVTDALITLATNNISGLTEAQKTLISDVLKAANNGANVMLGGELNATGGSVLIDGSANVLAGGILTENGISITADDAITLSGSINAVTGTSMSAGNIVFQNSEKASVDYAGLVKALLTYAEVDITQPEVADMLVKLGELKANLNVILGMGADTLVKATENVTLSGTVNLVGYGAQLQAGNKLTMTGINTGSGLTLGHFVTIPKEYAAYAEKVGLSALMQQELNANVVIAAGAKAKTIELISDLNLVANGSTLTADTDLKLDGTLNVLTSLGPKELMGALGNGITVSGSDKVTISAEKNDVLLQGTANAAVGLVDITAGRDVIFNGPATPLLTLENLTLNDLAGLAQLVGLDAVVGDLLTEYGITTEQKAEILALIQKHAATTLPGVALDGNVNLLSSGVRVNAGRDVQMLGTANLVLNNSYVHAGNNVTMEGLANIVAGGSTVDADGNVSMTGGMNMVVDTTVDNVIDSITGGSLGPIIEGGKKPTTVSGNNITLDATANVVNGLVSLNADNNTTLKGLVNLVGGGASVEAGNNVLLNGTLNVVANGATVTAGETLTLTGSGVGKTLADLVEIPAEYKEYADTTGLTALLNKELNLNAVMGEGTVLTGKGIKANAELNLIADGARLDAGSNGLLVDGTLNMVTSMGAAEILNSLQNKVLPDVGSSTTVLESDSSVTLKGTANVVHGRVEINALGGDVNLQGPDAPLLSLGTLTPEQMKELAAELGLGEKLGNAADAGLGLLLEYANRNGLEELLTKAEELGYGEQLKELAGKGSVALQEILNQYANMQLPGLELSNNVNVVTSGAKVAASNNVNMTGTMNLVANCAQVTAGHDVNMNSAINAVAGGAAISAGSDTVEGDINMNSSANLVVDTTLGNVVDAIKTQSLAPLMQGGSNVTSLTATGDINMNAIANVVNGSKVSLQAGKAVNMDGALNVVASQAQVHAANITMGGTKKLAIDLKETLPAGFEAMIDAVSPDGVLNEGINLNLVAGGADLTATNNITMTGTASVVVDTTLTNVMDAIKTGSLNPLLAGGSNETTLTAQNINMQSVLNVVNGGKVVLDAGNSVLMSGLINAVGGNARVDAAKSITLKGVGNVVANGADLSAQNITLQGNAGYGTAMGNLFGALTGLNLPSSGSASVVTGEGTTLTATQNVNMLSNVNLLADKATVSANAARMAGTVNSVTGGASLNAANTVTMLGTIGNAVLDGGSVTAGGNVTMTDGMANVVLGGTVTSTAGDVTMEGLGKVSNGITNVVNQLAPDNAYAAKLANLLAKGNVNVVAGSTSAVNALKGSIDMTAAANVVAEGAKLNAADINMYGAGENGLKVSDYVPYEIEQKVQEAGLGALLNVELNGNVVSNGAALTASNNVVMDATANVIDNATVNAGNGITINGSANVMNASSAVAGKGDININGGLTVMSDATLKADGGSANFTGATVTGTGIVAAAKGMNVTESSQVALAKAELGGTSTIAAGSSATIGELALTSGKLTNEGTLSLEAAVLTNSTLHSTNNGLSVTGTLNLNNSTLVFDAQGQYDGFSAINLSGPVTLASGEAAMASGNVNIDGALNLVFNLSGLPENATTTEYGFAYTIFTGVADAGALAESVKTALSQGGSVTFTHSGGLDTPVFSYTVQGMQGMNVTASGGNVVLETTVMLPEPTTATLSLLALAGLCARRRRKQ